MTNVEMIKKFTEMVNAKGNATIFISEPKRDIDVLARAIVVNKYASVWNYTMWADGSYTFDLMTYDRTNNYELYDIKGC